MRTYVDVSVSYSHFNHVFDYNKKNFERITHLYDRAWSQLAPRGAALGNPSHGPVGLAGCMSGTVPASLPHSY